MKAAVAVALIAGADAQVAGSLTAEENPALSFSECDESGCNEIQASVTIDSNWRWTHKRGDTTNCYTGNLWDTTACPDQETCWQNCEIEGAGKEYTDTYGVNAEGNKLELGFVTNGPYSKNVGSRLYLLDTDKENYKMFMLKNREFTFDVDVSKLPCGLNGALYFVEMDKDGGKSKHPKNTAGAKYGTGYCDAQCPHDLKWINGLPNVVDWKPQATDKNAGLGKFGTCCTELDMWEANSISTAYTMHSCKVDGQTQCSGIDCGDNAGAVTPQSHRFEGVCDKNGCDFAPNRLGDKTFYGPGSSFTLDTTKPMTVVTQFITDSGDDSGTVNEVRRTFYQDGKEVKNPEVTLLGNKHDSITQEFCEDWVGTTKDGTNFIQVGGGMADVDRAISKGLVLVMSLWDDHFANMLWLDSIYPTDSTDPTNYRGSCGKDSGLPADVESKNADSKVVFSNIKVGKLGTTTPNTPSPSPTPTPTPSPSPSGCPGGSLDACIDLCPADIFQQCAESCSKRCPHASIAV